MHTWNSVIECDMASMLSKLQSGVKLDVCPTPLHCFVQERSRATRFFVLASNRLARLTSERAKSSITQSCANFILEVDVPRCGPRLGCIARGIMSMDSPEFLVNLMSAAAGCPD